VRFQTLIVSGLSGLICGKSDFLTASAAGAPTGALPGRHPATAPQAKIRGITSPQSYQIPALRTFVEAGTNGGKQGGNKTFPSVSARERGHEYQGLYNVYTLTISARESAEYVH